jgi:hypothetical protein
MATGLKTGMYYFKKKLRYAIKFTLNNDKRAEPIEIKEQSIAVLSSCRSRNDRWMNTEGC